MRRPSSSFKALAVAAALLLAAEAAAAPVVPVEPVTRDGKTVGYTSNDPHVSFLVPAHWGLEPGRVFLEAVSPGVHDLYFVLAPSFADSYGFMGEVLADDPTHFFAPLPFALENAWLDLPELAGQVEASFGPVGGSQSLRLYFRIRMDATELALLRALANGQAPLAGGLSYTYETSGGSGQTTAPILVGLKPADLQLKPRDADYGFEWLSAQIFDNEMVLPGVIDGSYSLGVTSTPIEDSLLTASFVKKKSTLTRDGLVYRVKGQKNLDGRLDFYLPLLGKKVAVVLKADLDMRLDLSTVAVKVERFKPVEIVIADASLGPFWINLVKQLLSSDGILDEISEALTEELRERILQQRLFLP